jgi:hypothetical protein
MTATSVVCPECGSPVAPGRLSCQSCGAVIASVVGSGRPPIWATASTDLPEIDEDRPLAAARQIEPAPGPAAAAESAAAPKRGPRRLPRAKPAAPAAPAKGRYVKSPLPDPAPPIDQAALFGPVPSVAPPILHDWSDRPSDQAVATATSTATAPRSARGGDGPLAGAYLAPSATYAVPVAAGQAVERSPRRAQPASAQPGPAQASAWPSAVQPAAPAAAYGGNGASGVPSTAGAPATSAAGTARTLSDWLVIGGTTLAIVSFVLPWATDGVIGAVGSSYLANWGLANPGHLLLIGAAVAVLLLGLVDNPVPAWFRSGALPLLVGGIMAGLAFAYYARPAGGGAGVAVMLAGALVLIGGGLTASRPSRHESGSPGV